MERKLQGVINKLKFHERSRIASARGHPTVALLNTVLFRDILLAVAAPHSCQSNRCREHFLRFDCFSLKYEHVPEYSRGHCLKML